MAGTAAGDGVDDPGEGDGRRPGEPTLGSAVTLVPAGDVRLLTGVLLAWREPSGPDTTVTASVDIAPTSMRGQSLTVWATVQAAGGDTVVLSADATRGA